MQVDAAPAGTVAEEATPETVETIESAAIPEDAALDAIYDKMTAEEPAEEPVAEDDTPADRPEEPEQDEIEEASEAKGEAEDTVAEAVDAPSDLPRAVREHWADIPEEARQAIADRQRELSNKLAANGKLVQGISPIRDVLVQAAKDLPSLANMRPQDVASQVFELAKISHQFNTAPVETMLGLIKQKGLEGVVSKALQGQPIDDTREVTALKQQVGHLQQQLSRFANPEYLREQVATFSNETQMVRSVEDFATKAEHWDKVEAAIPQAIQLIQQMQPALSPQDTLQAAYDLAVGQFVPEAKAKTTHSEQEPAATDPEKTKAALKAKSVNVASRAAGKKRPMTEDEMLDAIWARNHS